MTERTTPPPAPARGHSSGGDGGESSGPVARATAGGSGVGAQGVARAICHLASPASSSTTATVLAVDGGTQDPRLRAPG